MSVVKTLFYFGPLFFGLAILAPLTAQVMTRFDWVAPAGLTPLEFGLMLGGVLGLVATIRGRWI
jgi:hypothetical protein